jgi:tetratricopeptide (TPR) repeat protein
MNNNKNEQVKIILPKLMNLFNMGNYNLLITHCKKNIKKFPEYVVLYNLLGSAYMNTGKYNLARDVFQKAQKMDPTNISIMNNLANSEKNLFNFNRAEELFCKIIDKKPDYLNAYVNYGNLKRDLNLFHDSNELYLKALKINNKQPVVLYLLAMNYQSLGNFELSIEYANKSLKIDPKFTTADLLISKSKKYEPNDQHLSVMELKLKDLELSNAQKYNLHFSIAKAYEDINNITKSYENLKLGNNLKKKSSTFKIELEIKLFNDIKKVFSKIDPTNVSKNNQNNQNIIFILGMPRSGTTLTEQIISSHSQVYGSGELPYLSKIISDEFIENLELSMNKLLANLNDYSSNNLISDKYFSYIKNYQIKQRFITDKAPLNFRWIGLIKLYFPSSKIIHCSRIPKDNCLSLYKNIFEGNLNFCYDEKDLGTYYNLYSDLMKFWNEIFPNGFLEVPYESLIKDKDTQIKKIINYCDLDWEEQCLSFNKNKNPIKTVSLAQARSPIYNSSVESYKKFSPYLDYLFSLV